MRYAQTYTKLGGYRERAVSAVQGQEGNSFVSDLIGLLRSEVDILMSCYLAAVGGLVVLAIYFVRHR